MAGSRVHSRGVLRYLGFAPAVVLALTLAACHVQSPAAGPTVAADKGSVARQPLGTVRFGMLPSIATSPVYVGVESGAYADAGLDVNVTSMADSVQVIVALATGQLDIGQSAMGVGALNAFGRGVDLKAVASANQDPPGHGSITPILVRADLYDSGAIRGASQLKGRRFASSARGTIGEYSVGKFLQQAGLTMDDLDVVSVSGPEQIVAFADKAIDVAAPLQPLAAQAVQKGLVRVLSDDYQPNAQLGLIVVNTRWAQAHPDSVVQFLVAYLKTVRRLSDGQVKNDQQALDAIGKYVNTPPDVVKLAPDPYWPKDGRINRSSLAEEQAFFLEHRSLDFSTPISIDDMIDESYLTNALLRLTQ
jgi:NitT/TauT family transport system substrate-binding protein